MADDSTSKTEKKSSEEETAEPVAEPSAAEAEVSKTDVADEPAVSAEPIEPASVEDEIRSEIALEPEIEAEPKEKRAPRIRAYILPLLTLVALSVLLINFRTVLLPFILACLVVYLMEPVIKRIGRTPSSPTGLPRWAAVIMVYLTFLGIVTVSVITIVPRFVSEFVGLGETIPGEVQTFREELLPSIDDKLEDLIDDYVPAGGGASVVIWDARAAVSSARVTAASAGIAHGQLRHRTRRAMEIEISAETLPRPDGTSEWEYRAIPSETPIALTGLDDSLGQQGWRYAASKEAAVTLVTKPSGGVEVHLSDVEIEVEQSGEGRWLIRRRDHERLPRAKRESAIEDINLQKSLDELISGLVDTSTEGITQIIGFARTLVLGVIKGFVGIVLTLMVAAFISIDLYRVKGFFRQLIPEDGKYGYDRFLSMADRGLGGVVRGQLLICLVNGVFTWVGLAIIGVRFSVLLGVVAGILSVIPVFGTILSTIPIVLIGLTGGLSTGVLALGWILLIHFVEANLLNPKIIGSSAHIHPVIVIFALLAGESAYGLVGALLAVPTASLLLTLFNFVRLKAWRESSEAVADAAQRT